MPIQLIVGLGNPGPQYDQTRHNAGFWFVDELARRHRGQFRRESRFSAEQARIQVDGHELWLLKPQTFMNRSGQAVRPFLDYFKVEPAATLVAHDEIDLAPGIGRLKLGGGHGGHNGLRDLIQHLGAEFWRLRVGVGHPGQRDQVVEYVLNRPGADDQRLIEDTISRGAELLPEFVRGEFAKAQQRLHSA
ncbi:MAG: aminoacyl-tRNA hydrolase [Thiotrichales bacterium]